MAKKAEIDSDKEKDKLKEPKARAAAKKKTKAPADEKAAAKPRATKPKEAKPKEAKPKETKPKGTKAKAAPKKRSGAALSEGKTLIIVESPAKARTLEKILGSDYHVEASVGHVRDLPKGRIGIDVENNFEPEYIQTRGKADIIRTLKKESAASKKTLLASDPDREGEAISWHLAQILGIDPTTECRIRMQEITKEGVRSAVDNPDRINLDKVDAQQSRRVLDRLVGYQLSPLLWYKVQRGLSAGRVQSVALRIICEREEEIEAFVPQEYWLLDVHALAEDGRRYVLRVEKRGGKTFQIESAEQSLVVERELREKPLAISDYRKKESSRAALPPFKTSQLQQEASRRLGFSPRRTMGIAQSLYEGIDIPGRGPVGLITYMRTDSLRISPEAIESSRRYIGEAMGDAYLPEKPNYYTPKEKAQDAHEAIRPTDPFLTPAFLKGYLNPEQFRLYELIWNRFIASQMTPARMARTTVEAACGEYGLKQQGIVVLFDGWGKLWPLGVKDVTIQPATVGEPLSAERINREQKFTQPPARFTDAGLVKVLEEKGIGRPSTYASIMETLVDRGYVNRGEEDKKLIPTPLGRIVCAFLVRYFPKQINTGFTAAMETDLDRVEAGEAAWNDVVREFWSEFKPILDEVTATAERMPVPSEEIGEDCPECQKPLVIRRGRFGEFIACTGFPDCRYTRKIVKTTGIACPKCTTGELVRRKVTKGKTKGRFFYACSRYPDCDFVAWKKPGAEKGAQEEGTEPYERPESDL